MLNRRPFARAEAKLEILSALYDDVASHLVHHLDALRKIQSSSLKRVFHQLEDLEVEQARVVTNLKSFLASISSAFSAFLGFARAGSCANGASAPVPSSLPQSPTPSNLLFAISIPDGIARFDQDALSDRMRVEHEAEQSHLAKILKEIHGLFISVATAIVSTRLELDATHLARVRRYETRHRLDEHENQTGRLAIDDFFNSVKKASLALKQEVGDHHELH
ncbi:hypothetical protein JCM3766R1_001499 [Sporobolomyces carnicolor]